VTKPVGQRAKEGAFGIYGGAYLTPEDRVYMFRFQPGQP